MSASRRMRQKAHRQKTRKSNVPLLGFRYNNRLTIPKYFTKVKLIKGVYKDFSGEIVPYHERVDHFSARVKAGFICSRKWVIDEEGYLSGSGNCLCCELLCIPQNDSRKGPDAVNHMSFRPLKAFLLYHVEEYHIVEATDKDGKVQVHKKDSPENFKWPYKKGDPIMRRVVCEKIGCDHCKENYEKVLGSVVHWSLGGDHYAALCAFADDVERKCFNCREGQLEALIYTCPECDNIVLDLTPEGDTRMNRDELAAAVADYYKCPHCQRDIMLEPIWECDNCKDPKPTDLFDIIFEVKKVGDERPTLSFGRIWYDDLPDEMTEMKPKDDKLERVFRPDGTAYQAKRLDVRNPFKDGEDASENYDDPDGSVPDDDDDLPF